MDNDVKLALLADYANEITMNKPFVFNEDLHRIDNIDNHYEGNDITVTIENELYNGMVNVYYQITMTGLTESYTDGLEVINRLQELYTPIFYTDRGK